MIAIFMKSDPSGCPQSTQVATQVRFQGRCTLDRSGRIACHGNPRAPDAHSPFCVRGRRRCRSPDGSGRHVRSVPVFHSLDMSMPPDPSRSAAGLRLSETPQQSTPGPSTGGRSRTCHRSCGRACGPGRRWRAGTSWVLGNCGTDGSSRKFDRDCAQDRVAALHPSAQARR